MKRVSFFKDPQTDRARMEQWVETLERLNGRRYDRICLTTQLGTTIVYGLNTAATDREALVIFPGARTSVLFWDFDNALGPLAEKYRIFLVETNGLPNLSDGHSPEIRSTGYGEWASDVMAQLGLSSATIAGSSFGGLVCMKLCIAVPEKVKAVFLLNPGCLQPFSLSIKNLYYNLLPIVSPKPRNVETFLDKAVLCKPHHMLPAAYERLLIDYEVFALTRYSDRTQKPYYMNGELEQVKNPVYLLVGDKDLLFPYKRSISNARKHLSNLREVQIFQNVGHGIETYRGAHTFLLDRMIKNT
jgi:pimeloyl-ACP methyl ester carboxylesterase